MKTFLKFFKIFLLMCGVFSAETDDRKTLMEGDSVTLNPDPAKIQGFILMQWRFGEEGPVIAQIEGKDISNTKDERFRDRLHLDQTGSLTIKNMRIKHSGPYELEINHRAGTSNQKFSVAVYESPAVIDAVKGEMKIMSVTEGNLVTLQTDVTELQGDELIEWRSGDEGKLIAKSDNEAKSPPFYDNGETFKERLKLDQTGSLTITNARNTHSGLYRVKISSNNQTLYKRFTVTVSASGWSPGAVAGIVIGVLLASAAVAAVVWYYRRPITTKLPKQTWSVPMGDDVTLNPETEIQKDDEIQWLFRDEDTLIAEIRRKTREMKKYNGPDEIFMYTLTLDEAGSLIINNINIEHTGLYILKIRRGREILYKRFIVSVDERMMRYVTEGDPVSLTSDTAIHKGEEVQWLFDEKQNQTVLAEIKNTEVTPYKGTDERFRDGLEVNRVTCLMTIRKSTAAHSGYYTLKISRATETLYKRFNLYVEERPITVIEGHDVTLKPAAEIKKDDLIQWMFVNEGKRTLIAELKGETREIFTYDRAPDGRFRDRLELDETGSLTITDTTTEHTGVYRLKVNSSSGGVSEKTFIVTVKDKVEKKLVKEGESVTLKPDTKIQTGDQILWMFGDQEKLIAQIKGGEVEKYDDGVDERFRGRLKLDETGSLTITDTRPEQTGLYKLQIINRKKEILYKGFKVLINYKVEKKLLNEGDDVTLKPDTKIQTDDEIQWMFGDQDELIAQIKGGKVERYDDGVNKRFRGRLKLDESGSLTITDIRPEHAGLYKLQIISGRGTLFKRFKVLINLKNETVTVGDSVTLKTGFTEIQINDGEIQWLFGDKNSLIAERKGGTVKTYDVPDKRFRDRLELNETTGDLTISNCTAEHAGCYKLKVSSSYGDTKRTYSVLVRDSTESRVNESATVVMPLLNGEEVNEEGTSSL